jgi:putative spermidine/putrescine transport system permease protein
MAASYKTFHNTVHVRHVLMWIYAALALLYILAPLVFVVIYSFSSVAYSVFPPPDFSLRWYTHMLGQDQFFEALYRSLYIAFITAVISLGLGTLASLALVRHKFLGRDFIKAFLMSPVVMPRLILGVALFIFFIKIRFYGNETTLVLAHTVVSLPFVVAVVTANLIGLDISLEEASMDLGATPAITFFRVVMPQIWPGLAVAGIFAFINSFDQIETSLFLVRPGNNTLPIEMFLYMEKWQDPTIAALSTMLIGFSVLIMILAGFILRKTDIFKLVRR